MKTLCAPTLELACFGCCPPIRPAHYDPLDFARSLRRELLDNRRRLLEEGARFRPIVGFSCWGLGFLDPEGRRAGCMLHPFQNGGKELRALIDYGDKCRRESCLPSRMFALLPEDGQDFWLPMATGLNTFLYSSPRGNPLFRLMLWGPDVLEPLRKLALEREWTETELLHRHGFLLDPSWQPQGSRYLFRLVLALRQRSCAGQDNTPLPPSSGESKGRTPRDKTDRVLERFVGEEPENGSLEAICRELLQRIAALPEVRHPGATPPHATDSVYTHRLPLEDDFRDLLRLGLRWKKMSMGQARRLKEKIEQLAREVVTGHD